MAHVLVKHKVKDFETWKSAFDSFAATRKSAGEKSFSILNTSENANDLTLLFEWDNQKNAEAFMNSSELKTAMQGAGVAEEPKIQILNMAYKGAL